MNIPFDIRTKMAHWIWRTGKWSETKKANIEIITHMAIWNRERKKTNLTKFNTIQLFVWIISNSHLECCWMGAVRYTLYACNNNDNRKPIEHHIWLVQLASLPFLHSHPENANRFEKWKHKRIIVHDE